MIITCEQCLTRFRIADDKVRPGGSKVRCSKCQHVFTILPPPPPDDSARVGFDLDIERAGDAGTIPAVKVPSTAPTFVPEGPAEFDFGFTGDTTVPAPSPDDTGTVFVAGQPMAGVTPSPPETAEPRATAAPAWVDSGTWDETPAAGAESTGATEPAAAAAGDPNWLDGTEEDADQFAFAEAPDTTESGEVFPQFEDEPATFDMDAVFGKDEESDWGEAGVGGELPFDFDTPGEAGASAEPPVTRSAEGGLGFGEISFGGPAAAAEPPPLQPGAPPRPQPQSLPEPAPLAPGPAAVHPPFGVPLPASRPEPPPLSRSLRLLVLLLLLLGGAGSYFYFTDSGQQFVAQLQRQVSDTGSATGPAEQRIGLNIAGSSYVDNRETGPLLVIQGTATNNFTGARSAITVKGMLLNAAGKVLQQQTVYCGNYLSEDKLQGMKYAQIEEAMNNQFGDGLANMNVRPGASLRFTIVFRNVPQDLGGINVEIADSKPGGP